MWYKVTKVNKEQDKMLLSFPLYTYSQPSTIRGKVGGHGGPKNMVNTKAVKT
jgi:hypothetical protein